MCGAGRGPPGRGACGGRPASPETCFSFCRVPNRGSWRHCGGGRRPSARSSGRRAAGLGAGDTGSVLPRSWRPRPSAPPHRPRSLRCQGCARWMEEKPRSTKIYFCVFQENRTAPCPSVVGGCLPPPAALRGRQPCAAGGCGRRGGQGGPGRKDSALTWGLWRGQSRRARVALLRIHTRGALEQKALF